MLSAKALYSASMEEWATVCCLPDFYENLNDKNYKWPFYFTLRDLEHVNLGNRVDDAKHQQK